MQASRFQAGLGSSKIPGYLRWWFIVARLGLIALRTRVTYSSQEGLSEMGTIRKISKMEKV
jgi:DNA-binding transcriptional regulator of glucitol operon